MTLPTEVNLLLASQGGGYQISRSVRLRSSASAYFNRTLSTPTSNTTWTLSCWLKRGALSNGGLFAESTGFAGIYFASDKIRVMNNAGGLAIETTAVFRDPSAWAHFVVRSNGTNIKAYWNSVEVGSYTGTITLLNAATSHFIGRYSSNYFDGYLTEVNFIDGQALDPSYFGETNPVTGVWQPKKYAGTYGTNGFYLNFSDNSAATAAAIGKDYSGNGNNWTPNNISVTAGVTYDSMLDVPTLWADGGNGRGNYWTFNPLIPVAGATYSNGNLQYTNSGNNKSGFSSPLPNTGKWYWEGTWITSGSGSSPIIGLAQAGFENTQGATGELGYRANGNKFDQAATETAYGSTWTTGDVIGVAVDMDAGTIAFYKNGTSQGTAFTTVLTALTQPVSPVFRVNVAGDVLAFNFGQRPFAYTPPTGFKALNTLNLPEPTILKGNQYFDATTYTGQNTSLSVTNSGSMQPDFVWIKKRNGATDHNLVDSVRGTDKNLISNSAAAESTVARLTSFDSGGFTLAGAFDNTNLSGSTYVGWQWKEGATQGFDIVTYTGTGVARTVAHSLGVAPSMMIVKNRTTAVAGAWPVYHQAIGATNYLFLDLTDAQSSVATPFNDTAPTSTVFSVDGGDRVNKSGNGIVAYLFAEVAGFSKFGSYTGNGSADGPFVFCGFRPRWVMIKRTDSTGDWYIWDTARNTFNLMTQVLFADLSAAESTYAAPNPVIDVLSNGFKQRGTYPHNNASGGTYIFAAFAESPFKVSLAR
jgi:hypothetical protein